MNYKCMSDCIFCKIINQEIPSTPIYESEAVYAFLDIQPVHPGHVLVVPKSHAPMLVDLSEDYLQQTILAVQKVARAMKESLGLEGFNIIQNNGAVAGQSVHHVHFHIIPRYADDGLTPWPHQEYASPEAAAAIAQKIKTNL